MAESANTFNPNSMDDWDLISAIDLIRGGEKLKTSDEWYRLDRMSEVLARRHNVTAPFAYDGMSTWNRLKPGLIKAKLIAPENDDINELLVALDDE